MADGSGSSPYALKLTRPRGYTREAETLEATHALGVPLGLEGTWVRSGHTGTTLPVRRPSAPDRVHSSAPRRLAPTPRRILREEVAPLKLWHLFEPGHLHSHAARTLSVPRDLEQIVFVSHAFEKQIGGLK